MSSTSLYEKFNVPQTRQELALWHMRELERLVFEIGAAKATVLVGGLEFNGDDKCKILQIHHTGKLIDFDKLFSGKGGKA